jgi:type IV secretory pathway VirJ component
MLLNPDRMNNIYFLIIGCLLNGLNTNASSDVKEKNQAFPLSVSLSSKKLKGNEPLFQTDFNMSLPLNLFPSSGKENLPLVIFISGDGGWGNFDQEVCENFSEKGMPVIGLDARKYFWSEKQPKEASNEIEKAAMNYMQIWNKRTIVLVGFSFGACVAPVIADNFSNGMKEKLKGLYCISPEITTDLEVHISDMLSMHTKEKYDVLNELKKNILLDPVCIFGSEENIEIQKHFSKSDIRIEILPGGHYYDHDYDSITKIIIKDFL